MPYPFVTHRQVIERLERDPEFVRECVGILHRRYVDRDILQPPAGWMASHRKLGEELYARITSAECTDEEIARAAVLLKRYAKQIAKILRDEQIARDPRLGLAAAVYGVRPSDAVYDVEDPFADVDEDDRDAQNSLPESTTPPAPAPPASVISPRKARRQSPRGVVEAGPLEARTRKPQARRSVEASRPSRVRALPIPGTTMFRPVRWHLTGRTALRCAGGRTSRGARGSFPGSRKAEDSISSNGSRSGGRGRRGPLRPRSAGPRSARP